MNTVRLATLVVFLSSSLYSRRGSGQTATTSATLVRFEIDACVNVPLDQARRMFAVQLGAPRSSSDAERSMTVARASCDGDAVVLTIDDRLTGKSLVRRIHLEDTERRMRARALALAAAEAVFASWLELEWTADHATNLTTESVSVPARSVALAMVQAHARTSARPRAPTHIRLLATISARGFAVPSPLALFGGGVRVGGDLESRFEWTLDSLIEHGMSAVSHGTVGIDSISVGPALGVHARRGQHVFRAMLGLRGGVVRFVGNVTAPDPAMGVAFTAIWAGPQGNIGWTWESRSGLEVSIALESGYVSLAAGGEVNGRIEVALERMWVASYLSFGLNR